jgi:hypothetical protein
MMSATSVIGFTSSTEHSGRHIVQIRLVALRDENRLDPKPQPDC